MYDYGNQMRRFGCHDAKHIRAMTEFEGELLADHGWVVRVYEVTDSAVFLAESGMQCVFDLACAVVQFTFDLLEFLLGREVCYAD